jgi:spore coat polysaccharide biosynthesis protein SpsF
LKTVAVVQARTGSTRLPGKVLLPLNGRPLLSRVMGRAGRATRIDEVVVATTTKTNDDVLVELAENEGWPIVRGSESDVLDRYVHAARARGADVIVRITSDCPLLDPTVVDATIAAQAEGLFDYASNSLEPRTFPRGLDTEVMTRDALERAWREDTSPAQREHVTPYIYRHPELFRLCRVPAPVDYSSHRWCVDTEADYELVRRVYEALDRDDFTWTEVLELLETHPDWLELNRGVTQRAVPPS